jgi:ABC-type transport system substrate-binding protein
MVENGCERAGDVYLCDGEEMSFRWSSTNDDPMRDELFDSVREDLAAVGIELVPDFIAPSAFVNRDFLFGGPETWQLLNFSWRATDDPSSAASTYLCDDTGLNVNRYCSETVDALIRSTSAIGDQSERAAIFNEADSAYLDDLAIIPLYQKPNLLVWASELTGPAPNWSQQSDLWNVAAWTGASSIVVALDHEPSLDPLANGDDAANAALSGLLYGATGMDPSHHRVPVLVDSIDVVEG